MIRALASRMPAQNAVIRPTGPAPMTVMSRISSSGRLPLSVMGSSRKGRMRCDVLAVEGVERALDRRRDAREDRRLALGERARLRPTQLLHQIEELAGIVRVERDHELLV